MNDKKKNREILAPNEFPSLAISRHIYPHQPPCYHFISLLYCPIATLIFVPVPQRFEQQQRFSRNRCCLKPIKGAPLYKYKMTITKIQPFFVSCMSMLYGLWASAMQKRLMNICIPAKHRCSTWKKSYNFVPELCLWALFSFQSQS